MTYEDILVKIRKQVIHEALELHIIEEYEVPEYLGKYYDEFGIDSFVNYLSYLIHLKGQHVTNNNVFMTLNKSMLRDKEKIEKRFKLKIVSVDSYWNNLADKVFESFSDKEVKDNGKI